MTVTSGEQAAVVRCHHVRCHRLCRPDHGGQTSVTIPAGGLAVSDAVAMSVPALSDVAVSMYLPEPVRLGPELSWPALRRDAGGGAGHGAGGQL
jgi:hypothetical protein